MQGILRNKKKEILKFEKNPDVKQGRNDENEGNLRNRKGSKSSKAMGSNGRGQKLE